MISVYVERADGVRYGSSSYLSWPVARVVIEAGIGMLLDEIETFPDGYRFEYSPYGQIRVHLVGEK